VHGSSSSELPTEAEVELIHTLKTASYTVRGPLLLGARLAGADEETCRALDAFSRPIGVAFQLRDDLLGTFGDPARTGKPSGGDIREGKRTGLIAALVAARPDARTASLLSRAFGRADADAADVDAILESMVAAEAPRKVEARIHALLAEATRTLDLAPIPDDSRALLRGAALTLAHREA
jgi:geranylgeranyl diphosphate synthase type I